MEAHRDWTTTGEASNVIGLLTIVQVGMTLRQTRKHEVHSLFDAEALVLSYKQSKTLSNHEYYENSRTMYPQLRDSAVTLVYTPHASRLL